MKKVFLLATIAVLALVSCQEQSQLNFSDFKQSGVATIKGRVTYDAGVVKDGANYVAAELAAAQKDVVVKVAYSEYSSDAKDTKVFKTETDANGNFTIEIPCGQKTINVEIQPLGFEAEYTHPTSLITTTAFFEVSAVSESVAQGETKVIDAKKLKLTAQSINSVSTRNLIVNISGKTVSQIEKFDNKEEVLTLEEGAILCEQLTIKLSAVIDGDADSRKLIYNVTPRNGVYELEAALYDEWDGADITAEITPKPFTSSVQHNYQEWYWSNKESKWDYQWKPENLEGYFDGAKVSVTIGEAQILMGVKQDISMTFYPQDDKKIKGVTDEGGDLEHDKETHKEYVYSTSSYKTTLASVYVH